MSTVITGAAGGLGKALAMNLAARGADLMLVDKDNAGLEALSDVILARGHREPGICAFDLAQATPQMYGELAEVIRNNYGGLNHLIHAAVEFNGLMPLDQINPVDWGTGIQVNVVAVWALSMACLPMLREAKFASITMFTDLETRSNSAYWGVYGVSKAALSSLADILTSELETGPVRVLKINPGAMRTALRASAYLGEYPADVPDPAEAAEDIVRRILRD